MTTTYKEYTEIKKAFFEEHGYMYKVETSELDEYNRYYKTYIFDDGGIWYEAMTPTFERATVEIEKVKIDVEVKMLRTEYWSTEASSNYYYERY